jgi:hypothetical protein
MVTAFYEVLTTMAAGALVAAVVFVWLPPQLPDFPWHPVLTGLLLLGLCGLPLLPGVFNFLTGRLAKRFAPADAPSVPRIGSLTLAEGILLTACGWGLLGLSVWSMLQGVVPEPPAWTWESWARCCGGIGLAYVAGFLAFVLPGGVGVREFFLLQLLAFAGPEKAIAAAVLTLRLVWTVGEVLLAGGLWLLRIRPAPATKPHSSAAQTPADP